MILGRESFEAQGVRGLYDRLIRALIVALAGRRLVVVNARITRFGVVHIVGGDVVVHNELVGTGGATKGAYIERCGWMRR